MSTIEDEEVSKLLTSCWQDDVDLFEAPTETFQPEQRLAMAVILRAITDYTTWFPRRRSEEVKRWFFSADHIEDYGTFLFYLQCAFIDSSKEDIYKKASQIRKYMLTLEDSMR